MRINNAIIISILTLIIGFFFNKPHILIPTSVLTPGVVDLFTRKWVISNRLGSAKNLSALLKLFFTLIGFYAMIGQLACIGLIIWWLML